MAPGEVLVSRRLNDRRTAVVVATDRHDGDFRVDLDPSELRGRRRTLTAHSWTWLRQVHGADVVSVSAPGAEAGTLADGAVTRTTGAVLAVNTADCAPIALVATEGVIGVAHAGWRGLESGIVGATVDSMRAAGARRISAVVGPCIHAGCYEFGPEDLSSVAAALGDAVRGRTSTGRPALDLPAGVLAALGRSGVTDVTVDERCTGCDPHRFSHRIDGARGRQVLAVWIDP